MALTEEHKIFYTVILFRPCQLLEIRLSEAGETEQKSDTTCCRHQLLDLVRRCLVEDPSARITAAAARDVLVSLTPPPLPTRADNLLLPSPVLLLTLTSQTSSPTKEPAAEDQQQQQLLDRIRQLCAQYGRLVDTRLFRTAAGGGSCCQLLVQFMSAQEAARARILLTCPSSQFKTATITEETSPYKNRTKIDEDAASDVALLQSYSGNVANFDGRLCLESPPREQQEMQRGFRSEFYPLDLWYQSSN
jgi:hypothetical protein